MIYNWLIDNWIVQYAPTLLSKPNLLAMCKVLLKPLKTLFTSFTDYRGEVQRQLRYNSQHIVLSNLLNNLFDNSQRRIYIQSSLTLKPPTYLFIKADNKPVYIYPKSENKPHFIYTIAEHTEGPDFIVFVATGSLTSAQEVKLKAVVNTYKHGAKRPLFKYTDGTIF